MEMCVCAIPNARLLPTRPSFRIFSFGGPPTPNLGVSPPPNFGGPPTPKFWRILGQTSVSRALADRSSIAHLVSEMFSGAGWWWVGGGPKLLGETSVSRVSAERAPIFR